MGSLRIIVGVTGGIAAYKAVSLVRSLVLYGHDVHVVPTPAALEFIGKPTFEAISRNPVETEVFAHVDEVLHVRMGQSADLVIVAPASADFLARAAAGMADDLLTATLLTTSAPVVLAPAMHTEMWVNAATQANVKTLRSRGITVIEPDEGQLTGSDSGVGRLPEPQQIIEEALSVVGAPIGARDLAGVRLLVTAGGTREALDPVRFLGNSSSGKQGVAFAVAAAARGAAVTLIAANIAPHVPAGVTVVPVVSAEQLADEALRRAPDHNAVVMAAAVADYRPAESSSVKMKKDELGETLTVSLVKNRDVLTSLVLDRDVSGPIIGFAAETASGAELLELGRAKMARKKCDYLVLNSVSDGATFGSDSNSVIVIDHSGAIVREVEGTKREVADAVLGLLV